MSETRRYKSALTFTGRSSQHPPTALVIAFGSLYTPRHGAAVRGRATLAALASLGVRSHVVSTEEPVPPAKLLEIPGVDGAWVPEHQPRYGFSWELVKACRRAASGVDFVVLGSAALLPVKLLTIPRHPIIWDTNECETLHYSRLPRTFGTVTRSAVWFVLEWVAVRCSQSVVAVSDAEAAHWARLFPASRRKLKVVAHRPFVVDQRPAEPSDSAEGNVARSLVFIGSMVAKHNAVAAQWLLEHLVPALPPGTTLVLVGPGTEALPIPLGARNARALGAVDDIDAVVGTAALCLAPLSAGAGVKTKILHYLAHGRPVIATPSAAEGLDGAPGIEVVELSGFVDAVVRFFERPNDLSADREREELQRAWLQAHNGADVVVRQWEEELLRLGLLEHSGSGATPTT